MKNTIFSLIVLLFGQVQSMKAQVQMTESESTVLDQSVMPTFKVAPLVTTTGSMYTPPIPCITTMPAENCMDVCVSCNFTGYQGSTAGWQADPAPQGWCSMIQNDQWFAFVAGGTTAAITVTPSNCATGNGIQVAVYPEDCNQDPLACTQGAAGQGDVPTTVAITGMIPGKVYKIVIDGFAADECDFTISMIPTSAGIAPNVGTTGPIAGLSSVGSGGTTTYSIPATNGAGYYTWSSPVAGVLFDGMPGPVVLEAPSGRTATVTFPSGFSGDAAICILPANACDEGTQRCKTVQILPVPQSISTMTVCAGTCVPLDTSIYCETGTYSSLLKKVDGSDSVLLILNLRVLNPIAQITGEDTLTCITPTLTLFSALSPKPLVPAIKQWRNMASGEILSNGDTCLITQTGTYILTTTMILDSITCTQSDTTIIEGDLSSIPVEIIASEINCTNPVVTLLTNVFSPLFNYHWTGPDGFITIEPFKSVYISGSYTLSITSTQGCSGADTVFVMENFLAPILSTVAVVQPTIGLSNGSIDLSIGGTAPLPYSIIWMKDSLPFATTEDLTNLSAGVYTGIVTAGNGCSDTIVVTLTGVSSTVQILEGSAWSIRPNPNKGAFFLHHDGHVFEIFALSLYDASGKQLWAQQNIAPLTDLQIAPDDLAPGIYALKISLKEGIVNLRVVVTK